jgi:acyl-CoA synthetase (NDP forming)
VEPAARARLDERGALLGTLVEDGDEPVVTVADYVPLRNRTLAEAAFAVADDTWLEAPATRELLLAYGIPLVPERVAADSEWAVAAAAELGYPVVVKTATPGVPSGTSRRIAAAFRGLPLRVARTRSP